MTIKVEDCVEEVLRNFGTRVRFTGTIERYDGSTLWIRRDDGKPYLAFTLEALGFRPGAPVTFRKDGSMRAKDVKLFEPGEAETNGSTEEFSAKS